MKNSNPIPPNIFDELLAPFIAKYIDNAAKIVNAIINKYFIFYFFLNCSYTAKIIAGIIKIVKIVVYISFLFKLFKPLYKITLFNINILIRSKLTSISI